MTLKLFNTLTRRLEPFKPIKQGHVGFYSCGPTVYSYQHIGNLRTYVFNDLLKRVLLYNNYKVKHVMNYTDVGHLTSDADEGEDKIEVAAKKEKKTAQEIAAYYAGVFEQDLKKLNILSPDKIPKATTHIKEQIDIIKVLEQKGFTYQTKDGVYYDSSKFPDYTKLGKLKTEGLEEGRRVAKGGKKNKTDFALWKFSENPGKRQQEWDSPWGVGFPGWHIECSAMSSKYLGEQFDIHTGGEDHIQVHHTNEIAQSEAAFETKPWVRYWMHGAFLTFKGEKVSKSKGGLYTISELEEQGFEPLDYRYLCLNTHYRKELSFSLDVLKGAKNTYDRLRNIILELKQKKDSHKTKKMKEYEESFKKAVNEDLNMPEALAVFWELLRDQELGSKEKLELALDFDNVLGLGLKDMKEKQVHISEKISKLVDEREQARKEKDFKKADAIRDKLHQKGFMVKDTEHGPKLSKV